jgi:prepilin-type N-terminal cleavage/methylation domain-containing protein
MNPRSSRISPDRGFTLVELVIAAALATAVITVAVMAFRTISMNPRANTAQGDVTLGAATLQNLYPDDFPAGGTHTALTVPYAPNSGAFADAAQARDYFYEDLRHANAVFCLGRSGLNTVRPQTISVGASFQGRAVATPNDFRAVLGAAYPDALTVFQTYRGASAATDGTIFILQPSDRTDQLHVRAIYEIDLVPVTSPAGIYASVRRIGEKSDGWGVTVYYHVFYPNATALGNVAFSPLFVAFERAARASEDEGSVDRVKVAAGRPFYFVWWPDPSQLSLLAASSAPFGASDPRASYPAMSGRTAFFFAVPMMPAL